MDTGSSGPFHFAESVEQQNGCEGRLVRDADVSWGDRHASYRLKPEPLGPGASLDSVMSLSS